MLTFLRKIRRSLVGSGSVGKYLIYAVGEILLVMIGILLALQVNNWNEQKKDAFKEDQILNSLLEDFEFNIQELERVIGRIPQLIGTQQRKLTYAGLENYELNPEMKSTIRFTNFITSEIVDGSLSSVLNSEKLELVKSQSLKKKLTAYPAFIKKLKKQEDLIEDYVLNYQRPLHRKYISLAEILSDNPKNQKIKDLAFQSDFIGLLNDKEYFNITVGNIITNSELLNIAELLLEKTREIHALLITELDE